VLERYRRWLLALIALAAASRAQVVRVCNYGTAVFAGWHRTTVDSPPPQAVGVASDGTAYAVGHAVGLIATVVDLHLVLAPGEARKIDLGAPATDAAKLADAPPVKMADVGVPQVCGAPLALVESKPDGAGMSMHWRGRPLWAVPMLCADCWSTVYPGQPWSVGELVVTASDPSVPDVVATAPGPVALTWSNGVTIVDGLTFGAPLFNGGETFGNGQSRAWRFVFGWLDRATLPDIQSALLESGASVAVCGISRPGLLGGFAAPPARFDATAWAKERLPKARAALTGWDILRDSRGGSVGVSPRSGDTGDQEDQPGVNKGVEESASPATGPYWVTYYAALGQLRRPCHHLEAIGSPLDWKAHPDLSLWVAQPNFPDGAAKDHLGKSRMVQLGAETHGWEGPDTEHWFVGRLAQALQWTASPALQWELQHEARLLLFTATVDPRFATTQITDASRAWWWEAGIAAWCWELLEDRELAAAVKQRMRDRVALLYPARFASVGKPASWFDVRFGDSRITQSIGGGFTAGTLCYQQSVASLMQVCGELLGDPLQVEWAQRLARTAVDYGWTQDAGGRWVAWDMVGVNADGVPLTPAQMVEGQGAHRTGFFDSTWCATAPWVVLRAAPQDPKAGAILKQLQLLPTSPPNQPVRTNDWLLPVGVRR
jgi:hypothetical protein